MSQEQAENPCKQRFKGIEHFLRRIAYNLGNTASETEVKIISCVPIDVTDLQQKILCLENELHEARQMAKSTENKNEMPAKDVGPELYKTPVINQTNPITQLNMKPSERKKTQTTLSHECSSAENGSFAITSSPLEDGCVSSEIFNTKLDKSKFLSNERFKSLFKKRKKKKTSHEQGRGETQLIYFAQTRRNTKSHSDEISNRHPNINVEILSSSYLSQVFQKHYDPKSMIEEFSDTSQFSQPICRDLKNRKHIGPYESDICSCCQGRFHNLDNFILDKTLNNYIYMESENDSVDLIPVKEQKNSAEKYESKPNEEWRREYDLSNTTNNDKNYESRYRPVVVNYEMNMPIKNKHNYRCNMKDVHKNLKHESVIKLNAQKCMETSKSCSIDCGNTYIKFSKVQKSLKDQNVGNDDKDFKLEENEYDTQLNDCTKTELALNEIKNILQSVLAEVKITSLKGTTNKRDAIVQKGGSCNNVGGSTFLQSYTYNPSCNANPYVVPFSKQMTSTPYCFPNIPCGPLRFMQNYPAYIQPSLEKLIYSYYHKNHSNKMSPGKDTMNMSTNTEKQLQATDSKETEKLIKEIYKSLTLNMGYPNKDNSSNGYDDIKSTVNVYKQCDENNKSNDAIPEVSPFKKDVVVEASLSPLTSYATDSKVVYTATSSLSRHRKKSTGYSSSSTEAQQEKMYNNYKKNRNIKEENEHSDKPVSVTESFYPRAVYNNRIRRIKRKQGLLTNMFKTVNLFKKNKVSSRNQITSAVSDSDEYETVCSEKADKCDKRTKKRVVGINYSRLPANFVKKRPANMDQEQRRQWNEYLTFNKNDHQSYIAAVNQQYNARPLYWRNYEARSVIVEPLYMDDETLEIKKGGRTKKMHRTQNKQAWLKTRKLGLKCGKQWQQFILES